MNAPLMMKQMINTELFASSRALRTNGRQSCDGRVVKALDLKSNGIFPRGFEPCSQRQIFYIFLQLHQLTSNSLVTGFLEEALNKKLRTELFYDC